jgi:hypothetical protein
MSAAGTPLVGDGVIAAAADSDEVVEITDGEAVVDTATEGSAAASAIAAIATMAMVANNDRAVRIVKARLSH